MNQRTSIMLAALLMIAFSLLFGPGTEPAEAWTGIVGEAIDSVDKDPWVWGGDVYVVNESTGDVVATTTLDGNGAFSVAYGDDGLGCSCVGAAPVDGDRVTVYILFNSGGGGTPGTGSISFTEAPIAEVYNVGYIQTGTGPTAITLQAVTTAPATTAPFVLAGIVLFRALGGKREDSDRP